MQSDCVFCRIVAGEAPAHVIAEDGEAMAFLSLENHPLVVPKQHVQDLYGMTAQSGGAAMALAARVARAMRVGLECDGVYLTQSNGAAAGQEVMHFHLHLYPCWRGRETHHVGRFFRGITALASRTPEAKSRTLERIRAAMAGEGD